MIFTTEGESGGESLSCETTCRQSSTLTDVLLTIML